MTPETYMKRYHGAANPTDALEGAYPVAERTYAVRQSVSVNQSRDCGYNQNNSQNSGCGRNDCQNCGMANALGLLCNDELSSLVDFNACFFLTDTLAVGSPLAVPAAGDTDNIAQAPAASLKRFTPNSSDLIDVAGTAYFAIPGSSIVALDPVDQLNACALKAAAFNLEALDCIPECPDSVYRWTVRALRSAIEECGGETGASCSCGGSNCQCNATMAEQLSSLNLSRSVTLAAGGLVLNGVSVIGSLGDTLVLASEDAERLYFVDTAYVEATGQLQSTPITA